MPILPRGLSSGFLDRLKTRLRETLAPSPAPDTPLLRAPEPDEPERARELPPHEVARGASEIMARIQYAGRNNLILRLLYNGFWRDVEPYSYRYRAAGTDLPLFYGWCAKHQGINAFRVDRIQDVQITTRPYTPRWVVEF